MLAVAEGTAVADLECVKQAVFMLGSLSEVSSRLAPKSSGVPLNLRLAPLLVVVGNKVLTKAFTLLACLSSCAY